MYKVLFQLHEQLSKHTKTSPFEIVIVQRLQIETNLINDRKFAEICIDTISENLDFLTEICFHALIFEIFRLIQ